MADAITINEKSINELVRLGQAAANVRNAGNTPFVIIPNDHKVVGLADFVENNRCDHPYRVKAIVKVLDASSFCHYYTLFSDMNSRVFADETANKILAIIDYHGAGSDGGPRWGEHRIDLTLRPSKEWETWIEKNGQKWGQMDFAEFLEDNAPDIVTPSAATMLDVARTLSAKSAVDFGSAIRIANGSVQFKYTEQVQGTFGSGNIDVPEQFSIAIPVYIGCERVSITARLRYRINSGKLTFWYNLLRPEEIARNAFIAARMQISETLKIDIINGSPA